MAEEPKRTMDQTCEGESDDDINLLDYWRVIWKRRRMIGWIAIVTVCATVVISLFMTNIYRAKAVIMPVTAKDGSGGGAAGLAALAQQFGGLPGISLPGSASASEIVSLLKSNILRERMIQQHNLMPVLFYKRWDPKRQAWKSGGDGFSLNPLDYASRIERAFAPARPAGLVPTDPDVPNTWDALRLLDDVIRISQDVKQNTITISADFHDPVLAARIVEYYLATLTDYMSGEAKRVARTNRQYLEEQLGSTADPIIKQKTYNMIAQQIETGMMAEVKENFAFKIIDPPLAPDKKAGPKRGQMGLLSLAAALFAGIIAAFMREYLERIREIPQPKKEVGPLKSHSRNLIVSVFMFFLLSPLAFVPQASGQNSSAPNITAQPLPGLMTGQPAPALPQMTAQQADAYQKLTPAQQDAVQSELGKSGGRLTPEAIEALKARPEFKGLTPEDVARGRMLLEERKKATDWRGMEKKSTLPPGREVVGEPPREKSLFDRSRSFGKYQDISTDLKPFGYEFFSEAAIRVVTDRKDIPVPLKYVIGAGDEVKLLLWGRINAQHNLTVDRDGKITIPQIGPLFVAGMTFEEMSKQIIKQSEQVVGTNVDISMGSLKTIPVFILGDVRRPGSYTIGSFATITDALLLAGGPTEIGSMRQVQLKRKGQLVTTFDLYDLLLMGDKSKDTTLMAGDVVFVPVTGPMVGIAGNVKRPAIYELRNRFDLGSVIDLAGGIIPTAYTQQIQVERIIRNERHVVFDINDKNMERTAGVRLQDADLVKVFSIVDMNANVVYINGNVKRPGKYEIKPGMRLKDLIKDTADLLPETYFDYALIKRLNPPEMETVLIPFSLTNLLKNDPASNLELKPQDQVYIFNRWFFRDRPLVTVEGEIRGDCNIEPANPNGNGFDYSQRKQGLLARADAEAIGQEFKEMEAELKKASLFDLAALVRDIAEDIRLRGRIPTDSVRILRDELIKAGQPPMVSRLKEIESRTRISCDLPLIDNMRVKDLILMAGGLTNDSYLEKGEVIRTSKQRAYQTLYFDVNRAMEGDPDHNLPLQNEDRIVIHSIWEQVYKKNVSIDGDVAKPGNYQYTEGMTVRDLVFKGGNILESAYVDEAEVSSIVIEKGRKTSKTERRVINLKRALEGDPAENLPLLPYDRLFVKKIPDWSALRIVTVTGEFKFPGRYTVHKGEKLSSLVERAGGYTANAYLRGAVFTRLSVKEIQQQGLEEMARRLEKELMVQGSQAISTALSAEEVRGKEVEMAQKQKFIETLKSLKAQGRMTIRLAHTRLLKGSEYDIELEDGDRVHLPQRSNVVNVMGSVMAQASYIYLEQLGYKDYIGMAGGYARYADESSTFVLKVDGSARKLNKGFLNWSDSRSRWELTAFGEEIREIEPGDVIVVPEKFDRIAWLREVRDITQILMNTAVVAATVIKLW